MVSPTRIPLECMAYVGGRENASLEASSTAQSWRLPEMNNEVCGTHENRHTGHPYRSTSREVLLLQSMEAILARATDTHTVR